MSRVDARALRRWGATAPPAADSGAGGEGKSGDDTPSKFPVHEEVNSKVALCLEDVWWMDVDAIVNSTNETLSDRGGVCGHILAAAGHALISECLESEGCRTGEATITGAGRLHAKNVIHTVGPKYSDRYKTAAENALHNCYRNSLRVLKENGLRSIAFPCIYTKKKLYPREDAAHIAIRSVRRFLENFGTDVDLVVLCVDNPTDLQIYQRIMPLYMPRNKAEERAARRLLPEDTGNELGETVIEDRKIRVGALPGLTAHPTAVPAKLRPTSPIDTTLAKRAGAGRGAGAGGGSDDDNEEANLFPVPNVPGLQVSSAEVANDFDFAAMRLDPDEERIAKTRDAAIVASLREEEDGCAEYDALLSDALAMNLADIAALNLIYRSGVDLSGHPVIVFIAAHVPAPKVDLRRVLMYIVRVLDEFVENPFTFVYVHSVLSKPNTPSYQFISRVHKILPHAYRKNIKAMYVVHPNFWLKTGVLFLKSTGISKKFWRKFVYVERVKDLFLRFPASHLLLPEIVYRADLERNAEAYRSQNTRA